jgi:hypothetical protein
MGQWEEFCTLCGGPLWIGHEYKEKHALWLKDIVGLLPDESIVRLGDYNGYGAFVMADGHLFDSKTNTLFGNATGWAHGIVCHRQCLRLIRSKGTLCAPVTYNVLWDKVGASGRLKNCYRRYLPISRYQRQVFDLQALYKENDEWLLESPAHANRNRERIVTIWQGLKNKPPVARSSGHICQRQMGVVPAAREPLSSTRVTWALGTNRRV